MRDAIENNTEAMETYNNRFTLLGDRYNANKASLFGSVRMLYPHLPPEISGVLEGMLVKDNEMFLEYTELLMDILESQKEMLENIIESEKEDG